MCISSRLAEDWEVYRNGTKVLQELGSSNKRKRVDVLYAKSLDWRLV